MEAGIVLCGLKQDLQNQRVVPKEDVDRFLKENNFQYFEVSSKFNHNVHEVFAELLAQAMLELDDLRPKYVPTLEELKRHIRSVQDLLDPSKSTNGRKTPVRGGAAGAAGSQYQNQSYWSYYSSNCNVM